MSSITNIEINAVIDYNINQMQNTGMTDIEIWNIVSKISILLCSDNFIITDEKLEIMKECGIRI